MSHEYTRQRQGRDFIEQQEAEKRNSMLNRLEQFKTEVEHNTTPIDGQEPPERVGKTHGF
ncbi:MAG: hypothetical protein FWD47_13335 [Treponema sp.]|nr:hypothetical protein [Treponema sp.]